MGILSDEMVTERLRKLLEAAQRRPQGHFGDQFQMQLLRCDHSRGEYHLTAKLSPSMCNVNGVVHGGICASVADHAMGIVSYCVKEGDRIAPTIQLQVTYHRPLPPEEVLIQVRVISKTRKMIHLSAEVSRLQMPETVCFSSTATYYCKD